MNKTRSVIKGNNKYILQISKRKNITDVFLISSDTQEDIHFSAKDDEDIERELKERGYEETN